MPAIEARLKDLLNETRLAMLGTQLLMGLQYNGILPAVRQPSAPVSLARWPCLAPDPDDGCTIACRSRLSPLAENGQATARMLARASGCLKAALLPLMLALGMDVAIAFNAIAGAWPSGFAGAASIFAALLLWFLIPMWGAPTRQREEVMVDKEQSLEAQIEQVVTELRIVLPGAQALFGFQFAAVLTASFGGLPVVLKGVHMASLGLVAAAVVMLIAPAAYHRIAAGGNAEGRVLRYAVRLMLLAQGFLAVGLIGDAYVTMQMVFDNDILAIAVVFTALATFVTVLYLIPLAARSARSAIARS